MTAVILATQAAVSALVLRNELAHRVYFATFLERTADEFARYGLTVSDLRAFARRIRGQHRKT